MPINFFFNGGDLVVHIREKIILAIMVAYSFTLSLKFELNRVKILV